MGRPKGSTKITTTTAEVGATAVKEAAEAIKAAETTTTVESTPETTTAAPEAPEAPEATVVPEATAEAPELPELTKKVLADNTDKETVYLTATGGLLFPSPMLKGMVGLTEIKNPFYKK